MLTHRYVDQKASGDRYMMRNSVRQVPTSQVNKEIRHYSH